MYPINTQIEEIVGHWPYGFPKIWVLFKSTAALQRAKQNGQLSEIASEVGRRIKTDPSFGRNRGGFDPEQGIWATANREKWYQIIEIANRIRKR
jgi:hypothetical protein